MNEREPTWADHWQGIDLFAFVEQREDVVEPTTGAVETAWVLDVIRADRTRPLLGGGSGARREIPFLGIAQLTLKQAPPLDPALVGAAEGSWIGARVGPSGSADATLYRDLDATETLATKLTLFSIEESDAAGLRDLVSLADVPDAEPVLAMGLVRSVSHVAVLNVGQGNCNALCDHDGITQGYYDLGGGCLWNAATRPAQLAFCFTAQPFVLLSHWDFDHWFGATLPASSGVATTLNWVAPRQVIGPRTLAFASRLPGLHIWPSRRRVDSRGALSLVKCRGHTKNESGLALFVKTPSGWVLSTGDAAWGVTPPPRRARGPFVGLVAPHHGSPQSNAGAAPPASTNADLAFSYGAGNTYKHPGSSPTTLRSAGWARQFSTTNGAIALGGPARPAPCGGGCAVGTVQP